MFGSNNKKSNDILYFAQEEAWHNKQPEKVLEDFIKKLLINIDYYGYPIVDDQLIAKLTDKLNNPYTPTIVKMRFIDILKIDLHTDKRSENLVRFEFSTEDFQKFLDPNEKLTQYLEQYFIASHDHQVAHSMDLDENQQNKEALTDSIFHETF